MKAKLFVVGFLATTVWSATGSAGIPEPDVILHGQVCIGGSPASSEDDVTIIAKATVDTQVIEVGRYKMGDHPAATDCNGDDDCYVLRIRLESVPPGESASGSAVVLDRANPATVKIFLVQGKGTEEEVMQIEIADSAIIRRLDLRDTPAAADLNGDGYADLADYQLFHASFQGPGVASSVSCSAADLNGDGYVDLRDFAISQATFTGSAP